VSAVGARPSPSTLQQWWVLTLRVISPTVRNGELLIAVALSGVFTASFYLPLKQVMGVFIPGSGSYAQYLVPLIAIQAVYFSAMSAAIRSATDSVQGIERRFRTMPMSPFTPLAARMTANGYRCTVALAIAVICGYVIGFRFYGGAVQTGVFCMLVLLVGLSLSLVGDLIGVAVGNPEATPHLLLLPGLILGYLSVGIQPAEQFPAWIRPAVRYQPISVFVEALRALAGDRDQDPASVPPTVLPALAYLVGISVPAAILYSVVLSRMRR
jgi:ABC-2 type transport system permease protein